MPVKSLVVRVYVHATEDEDRVLEAIYNIIPREMLEDASVDVEEYEGHYGNPIKVITFRLRGDSARRAFKELLSRMDSMDRSHVASSLDDRVDKTGTLHIRFSKQEAYQGRVTLFESDDVVKIEIGYSGGRRKALEEYKDALEGG